MPGNWNDRLFELFPVCGIKVDYFLLDPKRKK
jgi:hypothetical protein